MIPPSLEADNPANGRLPNIMPKPIGSKQYRFYFFCDSEVKQNTANENHQHALPCQAGKALSQSG